MTRHRALVLTAVAPALALVVACGAPAGRPASRAEVCQGFDALGDQLLQGNGVFGNPLFHKAGDLAGLASRYQGQPDLSRDAAALHRIAGADSTTGADLMDATVNIATLCGHPLALGT
ncbi:molybdenum ABC transporter substrate-binding protein [Streptantibioticus parmotrematis]|uniref:molybdenum ABC transporter substrate-binding protein n=1 Tax=Streptantibioticus parmotrematis TaxID=2873249 RepID=UPI0033C67979